MNKKNLLLFILLIPLITLASADIKVYEFYQSTCQHCVNVINSGILDKVDAYSDVTVEKYETRTPGGAQKYDYYHSQINMKQGVPLAVIECETGEFQHLIGDTPIINDLDKAIENCRTGNVPSGMNYTLILIIIGVVAVVAVYYYYNKNKK